MRTRNILLFSGAMFASAVAGSLVGPKPALAVAREIIELQRDVTSILQGQKDLQTQMTQDHTVQKTLVEQAAATAQRLAEQADVLDEAVRLFTVAGSQSTLTTSSARTSVRPARAHAREAEAIEA